MTAAIVYPLICAALYYLGAWALVTRWLWSRYPRGWFADMMNCASCSGFWYGALVALVGGHGLDLDFLGLDGAAWSTPLLVGLCSLVWTPIVSRVLLESNAVLGSVTTHRMEMREVVDAEAEESERAVLAGPRSS